MWLIIPLIYFLGWWQTGSFRQAFNGTIAWILGYALAAGTILILDVGGYSGIAATPDSPGAGLAILGGFVGMWISNIIWRRRGGDPQRKPGKWERSARAMLGMDKKRKKKKKPATSQQSPQQMPQQQQPQQPPPAQQQPAGAMPIDAQYRPATQQAPPFQQQPAQAPMQQVPPPAQPKPKQSRRNSPTADKYAKATGRALGAMFRGSGKKKSKSPPNR